jgi:hypothetical protein
MVDRKDLVAERKVLFNAIFVSGMDTRGSRQRAATLGIFSLTQMPLPGPGTKHFPTGGDFESFSH